MCVLPMQKEPRGCLLLIGKINLADDDVKCQKTIKNISDIFQSSLPENWDVESLNNFLMNDHYHFFQYTKDEKIIAGALISAIYETAELIAIAVGADFRRKGYGKELLDFIEEWLHNNSQVDTLILDVASRNISGVALYNKNQFNVINKREKYYEPNADSPLYDDAIVMHKIIERT